MNRELRLARIAEYLFFLTSELHLDIVISDMAGIFTSDPDIYRVLLPYLTHKNAYCMYAKNNQTLWSRCIILKESLMHRCERENQLFYGVCHCGVGEYVLPIRIKQCLIGFISATGYQADMAIQQRRLPAAARRFNLDAQILQDIYCQSMQPPAISSQRLDLHLSLVALLLTSSDEQDNTVVPTAETTYNRQTQKIIARAVDFINEMYANPISLSQIASHCNCSKSHLQHLFQKYRRQTIWDTMLEIRMDKARRLLVDTDHPIYLLASMVGYSDANYFSTVFARIFRIPPRQYRLTNRDARL